MRDIKDDIEEQMDLKRICTVKFRTVEGAVSEIRAHILRMEEVSGRKIIETDAGLSIGLDQIIEFNGRPAAYYC